MISERKLTNSLISKVVLNKALILDWRRRKKYTIAKAAKVIGVAVQTYVNAEHGRPLHLLTADHIARKTGIPFEELKEV